MNIEELKKVISGEDIDRAIYVISVLKLMLNEGKKAEEQKPVDVPSGEWVYRPAMPGVPTGPYYGPKTDDFPLIYSHTSSTASGGVSCKYHPERLK